jgi:glucans biosynthesis protein C
MTIAKPPAPAALAAGDPFADPSLPPPPPPPLAAAGDVTARADDAAPPPVPAPAPAPVPAPAPAPAPAKPRQGGRMAYIDWIRLTLTVTVVVHHCVYNFYGNSPWLGISHPLPADELTDGAIVAYAFIRIDAAYFMSLFYFLSGFFTPHSLARKGPWKYLADRTLRLLVPVAVYDVLIAPLIYFIAWPVATPGNPPGLAEVPPPGTRVYAWYWSQYRKVSQSPMWFIVLLFLFDTSFVIANALWRGWCCGPCRRRRQDGRAKATDASAKQLPVQQEQDPKQQQQQQQQQTPPRPPPDTSVYSTRFMLAALWATALVLSLVAFLVRLAYPLPPSEFTPVGLSIPVGYLANHLAGYWLGIAAFHAGALPRFPSKLGWASLVGAGVWFACGWVLALPASGGVSWVPAAIGGGNGSGSSIGFQAYYAFYEMIFAVFWSFGFIVAFRDTIGGRSGGRAGAIIIGAAYTAYIIHTVFIVAYDRALLPLGLPLPAGAAVLAVLVTPSTWIVAAAFRELVPGAKRIL